MTRQRLTRPPRLKHAAAPSRPCHIKQDPTSPALPFLAPTHPDLIPTHPDPPRSSAIPPVSTLSLPCCTRPIPTHPVLPAFLSPLVLPSTGPPTTLRFPTAHLVTSPALFWLTPTHPDPPRPFPSFRHPSCLGSALHWPTTLFFIFLLVPSPTRYITLYTTSTCLDLASPPLLSSFSYCFRFSISSFLSYLF